jgi:hypothetical protein
MGRIKWNNSGQKYDPGVFFYGLNKMEQQWSKIWPKSNFLKWNNSGRKYDPGVIFYGSNKMEQTTVVENMTQE